MCVVLRVEWWERGFDGFMTPPNESTTQQNISYLAHSFLLSQFVQSGRYPNTHTTHTETDTHTHTHTHPDTDAQYERHPLI